MRASGSQRVRVEVTIPFLHHRLKPIPSYKVVYLSLRPQYPPIHSGPLHLRYSTFATHPHASEGRLDGTRRLGVPLGVAPDITSGLRHSSIMRARPKHLRHTQQNELSTPTSPWSSLVFNLTTLHSINSILLNSHSQQCSPFPTSTPPP